MSLDPRESFLERMAQWRSVQPWARVDPHALAIREVTIVGPLQLRLETRYEARGIRYRVVREAPTRPDEHTEQPDPWAVALDIPLDAAVGHEITMSLGETERLLECAECSTQGDVLCATCVGTGAHSDGGHCTVCRGKGVTKCRQCRGSGGVFGVPRVWARIDEHAALHTLDTDTLPLEVVLDLSERPSTGEIVHRQDGTEPILEIRGEPGYRDRPLFDDRLRRAIEKLLDEPGVPFGVAVHRQTLEVRRTPVLQATLTSGRTLYVWGDPPRVHPRSEATTLAGKLFFFLAP